MSHLFARAFGAEIALSQLDRSLSSTEASGSLAVDRGMLPARRTQVPKDWPSPILRFLAPSRPSPKPSALRSAPRFDPPLTAA